MYKSDKAFTLIEIIIVTSLILITTTVTMANYFTSQKNVRDAKRKTDLENLKQSVEIYKGTVSPPFYPYLTGSAESLRYYLVPDYVSDVSFPQDPLADKGREYYYSSFDGNTFILCALLENKKPADADCPDPSVTCGDGLCNYGVTQP